MPNLALCCSSVDNLTSKCCTRREDFALEGTSRFPPLAGEQQQTCKQASFQIMQAQFLQSTYNSFVLQYPLQHHREAKILEKWKREENTYHQSFYAGKQKCFSMSDSFHQQDSLNLVCSADQIYLPFLGCSMCFPEDKHADVHLQIKE